MIINKDEFEPITMADALRVDLLCQQLLRRFHDSLLAAGEQPAIAGALAKSADYFIRDFVVDFKARNIFVEQNGLVRQFAGNWYIVSTLEPNISQLGQHLKGARAFYRFLHEERLISEAYLLQLQQEFDDLPYYEKRIALFQGISGDDYVAWEKECPLKG